MKLKEFILGKINYNYFLIFIIALGAFLRLYNFPRRFGFDFDAARDSLVASLFSEKLIIPLTGASSSVAPFNFGPWYYYLLIIFEKLIPFYGSWISVIITNLLTIFVFYKIGEAIENKKLGLLLAFVFSISPSQLVLSTTLSNPSIIPLFSSLSIFFFIKYIKTEKLKFSFLMTLFIGLGISIHFQMAGFLILILLNVLCFKNKLKNLFISIIAGFIPFVPIVIFDFVNNFYNLKGLIFFITQSNNNVYVANRWLFYIRDFWPQFWSDTLGVSLLVGFLFGLLIVGVIAYLLQSKIMNKQLLLLLIAFIFNFFLLRYFPSQKPIYYLYFLQSFIFIFMVVAVYYSIKVKKIFPLGFFVMSVLIINSFNKDLKIIRSESSNREVFEMKNKINKDTDLYICESSASDLGMVYLLRKEKLISPKGEKFITKKCDVYKRAVDLNPGELKNKQVHRSY